jgi:predicted transcriptional regulator
LIPKVEFVWQLGPATVREVHEELAKNCGYNTTLTQMRLMAEKGLLRRSERFRNHVYEPAVPCEQMPSKRRQHARRRQRCHRPDREERPLKTQRGTLAGHARL